MQRLKEPGEAIVVLQTWSGDIKQVVEYFVILLRANLYSSSLQRRMGEDMGGETELMFYEEEGLGFEEASAGVPREFMEDGGKIFRRHSAHQRSHVSSRIYSCCKWKRQRQDVRDIIVMNDPRQSHSSPRAWNTPLIQFFPPPNRFFFSPLFTSNPTEHERSACPSLRHHERSLSILVSHLAMPR